MGLGKTIQVLALLEDRRTRRVPTGEARTPSLVVAPKTLIFNWLDEARRFTPKLRMLNLTGLERANHWDSLADYDVVLTTYGTLRRDAERLKDVRFDYAILDEAQAIKTADTQAAKACRLLQADHKLAMTGTPIENRLAELWSLFEFLNPGLLGRSSAFARLSDGDADGRAIRVARQNRADLILRVARQAAQAVRRAARLLSLGSVETRRADRLGEG
jgi:SNF2 family DNA or RNA helicase